MSVSFVIRNTLDDREYKSNPIYSGAYIKIVIFQILKSIFHRVVKHLYTLTRFCKVF
jgi:hypothetical protein